MKKLIIALIALNVLGIALALMFGIEESKGKLYEQCYYDEIHSNDNRATKKQYEDNTKCLKLAQLEEKSGNFDRALEHYIRACVKVSSLMPDACAKFVEFAKKDPDFNLKGSLEEKCNSYDNKPACFELKKIELSELNEPSPSDLWDFMNDFRAMCHKFNSIVPQACDERDKLAQQYIRAVLALPKDEKGSYYVEKLNSLSRQASSLNLKILQMASSARDELISEYEKDCNENEAQSCAMLVSAYYGLLANWTYNYLQDSPPFNRYDREADKILTKKFKIHLRPFNRYDREVDKIYAHKFKALVQKSCDLGKVESCMQGAAFYYLYQPKQDYAVAREFGKKLHLLLKKAKFQGKLNIKDAEYLATLARIEATLDDKNDKAERKQYMLDYFKAGCDDLQSGVVCHKFAKVIYDEGEEERYGHYDMPELINQKQALHYYDKACALGVGCMRLAQIYLWGDYVGNKEVRRNRAKAKHYFTKDCDSGVDDYECGVDGDDNVCSASNPSCFIKRLSPKELENLDESIFN